MLTAVLLVFTVGCASANRKILNESTKIPWRHWDSYTSTPGPQHYQAQLDFLLQRAAQLQIQVVWTDALPGDIYGQTSQAADTILLQKDLTTDTAVMVLSHELGHMVGPPFENDLTYAEYEVFAELVGAGVCNRMGIHHDHASAKYLAYYKSGFHIYDTYAVDIDQAVNLLVRGWKH